MTQQITRLSMWPMASLEQANIFWVLTQRGQQNIPGKCIVVTIGHTGNWEPERDSVQRLKAYAERFHIARQWHLLTGNKDEIYNMARKSYLADEESGYNENSNEFLHTENCVLVDKKGRIRGVYNATLELEIDKLIDHIKILQTEE